jgi:hypothetical protein
MGIASTWLASLGDSRSALERAAAAPREPGKARDRSASRTSPASDRRELLVADRAVAAGALLGGQKLSSCDLNLRG